MYNYPTADSQNPTAVEPVLFFVDMSFYPHNVTAALL